jgi:glycerophosphoryl diester phosphodiesterase
VTQEPAARRTSPPGSAPPITFAHRGARADELENSMPAFRAALERGARGIETDAWLSADGEVVLVHDSRRWVRRLGIVPWRSRIETSTAARLARLGIPRLVDVYSELGCEYELSIDLKATGVGQAIVAVADRHGDPARCWLCSPSTRYLHRLRAASPVVRLVHSQARTHLRDSVERHAKNLADADIDVMNMHHSEWTAGLVTLFHRFGVLSFAWDCQEVRHLLAMLRTGIDGVYSDHVDRMVATVAEFSV